MSLSIYDPIKQCFVLRPMKPEVINAFHPDYVKTYMPDLLTNIKRDELRATNGVLNVTKLAERRRFDAVKEHLLQTTTFHIYNKAGAPKMSKTTKA